MKRLKAVMMKILITMMMVWIMMVKILMTMMDWMMMMKIAEEVGERNEAEVPQTPT